nr:glycosyltransferase [Natrinema sp. 1APR25-10V2]
MPPPTSVLLPTTTRSPVIKEVATQLSSPDELLVICDDESDPIADADAEYRDTQVIMAGKPRGCSGKANAIAAGMEAAAHDRIVWTDDDFHHPSEWLSELHKAYDRSGPVSELPFLWEETASPCCLNRFMRSVEHLGRTRMTKHGAVL